MKKAYLKPVINQISIDSEQSILQASSHIHSVTGKIYDSETGGSGSSIEMEWGGSSDNDKEKDGSGNIWGD